ncbi:MAG: acyl-CoA dehydratase activase-related protein, partial [Rectinemataceae bacterium]
MSGLRLGIDVGSTTVKLLILDGEGQILFSAYERHRSDIGGILGIMLERAAEKVPLSGNSVRAVVTGSAGIGVATKLGLPFVQEVIACTRAVEDRFPLADVAIELGGEDAKITYFGDRLEQRMNGSCAGGTGAFIDQMATVLGTDPAGLDRLASCATTVYPIAARCGVFSKADIQPLMNEGARREDLAASILQAVVNQTVSGLACGRPIRGRIAFLGGPLHYLPELRKRFALTLRLAPEEILVPDDGRLFVALGAALCCDEFESVAVPEELVDRAKLPSGPEDGDLRLPPLFAAPAALAEFRSRHAGTKLPSGDAASHSGPVFLGIDAGSTTTKLALIDIDGRLLASSYRSNGGHPLSVAVDELRGAYASMSAASYIGRACATGYGESLVRAALRTDDGEVETVAHSKAALAIVPDADSVLDIGGQDMKFLRLKNGMVSTVLLNEACSSGCGSFLEGFAQSLGMDAAQFSRAALESAAPVDLGSRCTVFMNSRVKQAQKEGASPADIAAGLAYSVIKNALHKVIKLKMASDVGKKVVVQGGTFASEAVLRAFELVSDIRPVRPVESGLMGAYGAALIARSRWKAGERSAILGAGRLGAFSYATEPRRCAGCANACLLTVTRFSSGLGEDGAHVTGNRCERGAELAVGHASNPASVEGKNADPHKPPDLFAWKYARLFRDKPLSADKAPRGRIGLPRSLNMYENYPFWSALLGSLGFSVELSPRSTKVLYERGMATIPSESVCYPAKLAHGHAMALIERGVSLIFDPCIPREERFVEGSDNCFNCPIVTSYPEVLLNNIEEFRDGTAELLNPFLPIASPDRLAQRIVEEFGKFGVSPEEAKRAVEAGVAAREAYRADLRREGEAALAWIERENAHGIVLAGRPYHIDPEIHHGIPSLITGLGMAVLSEDSIAHLARVERPLRVVDQWAYHSRLYAAASLVARRGDLDLVQLVSFGCGLDAVTSDQVEEILARGGKSYAGVKIDEHSNLGAARIRLRSLAAAIAERKREAAAETAAEEIATTAAAANAATVATMPASFSRPAFTETMRRVRTIIAPQMSPVHFAILEKAFRLSGYKFDILPCVQGAEYARVVDEGLRSVNNDACFPSILVVGQIMNAFRSGRYDPDSTAVIITQTGGGCRATNYIAFIRKALADAGLARVPVISLSAAGFESNPGFKITLPLVRRAIHAILYGDALMRMLYGTRPYEAEAGVADALADSWAKRCGEVLALRRPGVFRATLRAMV